MLNSDNGGAGDNGCEGSNAAMAGSAELKIYMPKNNA